MKKPLIVLGLLILLPTMFMSGVVFGVARTITNQATAEQVAPVYAYVIPQEMKGLATRIGLSDADLYATKAQFGAGQGAAACPPAYFVACYDGNTKTIHIYIQAFTRPGEDPATSLAYEFSHYQWQVVMTDTDRATIKPMLDAFYLQNKARIDQTQPDIIRLEGGFGSEVFEDELHAIACTEVADNELAPALLAHCSSYLPIRSALKNIY